MPTKEVQNLIKHLTTKIEKASKDHKDRIEISLDTAQNIILTLLEVNK